MRQIEEGEVKISDFRPIITCISEMVQDRTWAGYKNSYICIMSNDAISNDRK